MCGQFNLDYSEQYGAKEMWLFNDCTVIHIHMPHGLTVLLNFVRRRHSCTFTTGLALCSKHVIIYTNKKRTVMSYWWMLVLHLEASQQLQSLQQTNIQ